MSTFFNANNTVTGGSINNTLIGNLIPAAASFTSLQAAAGANNIDLQTSSGVFIIDSTSGDIQIGSTSTGDVNIGSSAVPTFDITAGTSLNLQSAGILNLTTVGGAIDIDSTSGDIRFGVDTTGSISVGSDSAGIVSLIGGTSMTINSPLINVGTSATATTLNIGTGPNISSNGITIGKSGVTTTIAGNLDVFGNINTINEANLSIENNHITLNANYDSETPLTGTFEVITDPEAAATQTLIATGGFTSTTTVNVIDATPYTVGDIIIITGANTSSNNNIFAIAAINTGLSPHEITIKTTSNIGTTHDSFIVDSTVAGRMTRVYVSHVRSTTTGTWQVGYGNNDNTFVYYRIIGGLADERFIFTTGTGNNISPTSDVSHFSCLHVSGTISGSLGSGTTNGFTKTIVCDSFPYGNELGGVRYDLEIQSFQPGRGETIGTRIFRFTASGQSVHIIWLEIPKTVTITCIPQADLNDNEYVDIWTTDDVLAYRFWFNVSGVAVGPAAGGKILVEVNLSAAETSYQVATILATVFQNTGNFIAVANSDDPKVVQVVNTAYTSSTTSNAVEAVLDVDFVVENHDGAWFNKNTGVDVI